MVVAGVLLVSVYASNASRFRAISAPRAADISFGGHHWAVKSSSSLVGPGPNLFARSNTSVDASGNLHLRIDASPTGTWRSAELVNTRSLGYGTYRFAVAADAAVLDANAVLGLFTWSDEPAFNHREIDIELARWGNATDPTTAQFVVQPFTKNGNVHRFIAPTVGPTVFEFVWAIDKITYRVRRGTTVVTSWNYTGGDIPTPGGEHAHLNLWLVDGQAPLDGQPIEVVLTDFDFCTPADVCG